MKKNRLFYIWFIPLVWAMTSYLQYFHPGDEYGMYVISSLPGIWIGIIVSSFDIGDPIMGGGLVALVGALVMTTFGFLMDSVKVQKIFWAFAFSGAAVAVFIMSIMSYPSLDRAIAKNGSIRAYVFMSINVGIYFSIVLSLAAKGIEVLFFRINKSIKRRSAL